MSALGLLALVPLVLSLILGGPGFAHLSPSDPSSPEPAAPALSSVDGAGDDWATPLSSPLAELSVEPLDLQPLPLTISPLAATVAPAPLIKPVATPPPPKPSQPMVSAPFTPIFSLLKPPRLVNRPGGPPSITADQIITTAESLLRVPYVWGGTSEAGLDCSAFVSRTWGIGRRTTESLPGVAFQIAKDELLPGDILNLTIGQDPRGYGHVRLFAGWANSQHSRMWVYEETPPRAVHRVINYDPRYTPLRRVNYSPADLAASHLLSVLFGRPEVSVAAPDASEQDSVDIADDDAVDDDAEAGLASPDTSPHGLVGSLLQGHAAPATGFPPLVSFENADTAGDGDHWLSRWDDPWSGSSRPRSSQPSEPSAANHQPRWQPTPSSWQPAPNPTRMNDQRQPTVSASDAASGQTGREQPRRPAPAADSEPSRAALTRTPHLAPVPSATPEPAATPRTSATDTERTTLSSEQRLRTVSSRPDRPGSERSQTPPTPASPSAHHSAPRPPDRALRRRG